jgi:signal transduction histidine kinase
VTRFFGRLPKIGDSMEDSPSAADLLARLTMLEAEFQRVLEAEKLEAMAEFAAGAGHEINNPLTVISGRAQLLLREETDPERRHALALINAQAMRVYEMIADMMLFARPPRPEFSQCDAVAILVPLIQNLLPMAERQNTLLKYSGPHEPVKIEADPTQLTVAVRALCQNAMEALGDGGHIEVGLEAGERELRIRISDDGPGITLEQRQHIFDPFYSARQAGRGLGLGLSKAWRIVAQHKGRMDVESQPRQGTTFILSLPRFQASSGSSPGSMDKKDAG